MLTKDKELFWFSSQVPDNVFANSERARSLALGFLELSDSTLSVSSGYASKYNHAFKLEGGKRKRGFEARAETHASMLDWTRKMGDVLKGTEAGEKSEGEALAEANMV